jgi:predicted RNA-binding protein with PIN domain
MNVMGSRPDGWWRDRGAARGELVKKMASFAGRARSSTNQAMELIVVFDGKDQPEERERAGQLGLVLLFAEGGPNSADHAIVSIVAEKGSAQQTTVVTSDDVLAGRVRELGAAVRGSGGFRTELDSNEQDEN